MRRSEKVIVSCAITGAIHTPAMSPHLPLTPEDIAESAVGAAEAGAAIVHLHSRDPHDGRPLQDPDLFLQFTGDIRARSDVIINVTTGGGLGMPLDERLAPARRLNPELISLNMGSINFGIFPAARTLRNQRTTGKFHTWRTAAPGSFATRSPTSRRSPANSPRTAHASSSSATTSATSTTSHTA